MKHLILSLAAAAALNIPPAFAAGCSAQSPAYRIALLELYTSEGCSSCPPADQYVSGLRADGVTAQQAVVLSEHVDYWNYIGWKDPFSSKTFTDRQRWLSDLAGSRTIYTPEIFVGGKEQRGWPRGVADAVKRANGLAAQADIGIALDAAGAGGLAVSVTARSAREGKLFVALVESGVASQVRAGENSGRLLRHDFVVREWLAPVPLVSGGAVVSRTLALPAGAAASKLGISAFVQTDKGEVLQALSLPVCGG
ncbi:DUF1223 domain-containing protein [Rugamonas sp. A1-17]|nr:DUF1223 domain-containing protein [Rugamonas sp. A1-17]